jgi:hypothetical protein
MAKPSLVELTLGLLFVPIITVAFVVGLGIFAAIFLVQSLVHGDRVYWWLFAIFSSLATVLTAASLLRRMTGTSRCRSSYDSLRYASSERKPTFVIVVLSIGFFSASIPAILIGNIITGIRPSGIKFFITLALVVASWSFMILRGAAVIRQHFGARPGRNVVLTGRQAVLVVVLVLCFGAYGTWLNTR